VTLPELRLRSARAKTDLEAMMGRLPGEHDVTFKLEGPCRVVKPDTSPLCVYLPGALRHEMADAYDVLHMLKDERTDNRGDASGTARAKRGDQKRTRSSLISSAVIGAVDPGGIYHFCRLTSWTGTHLPEWQSLQPLLQAIDRNLGHHVPNRWERQRQAVLGVPSEWVVPGTIFTTVTVNNTYSTGVHADSGDYGPGFSTLAVSRRGDFEGGWFVFPKWRIGIDMQDGDLLLLDAHELHGNTVLRRPDGQPATAAELRSGAFERISVIAYLRSGMTKCGTWPEEEAKGRAYADTRMGVTS